MENKNQSCLGIMVDLAGCPNRCRHCWLGEHRNGCMGAQEFIKIAIQFKRACEAVENGCRELSFFSWWREPDFPQGLPRALAAGAGTVFPPGAPAV